MRKRVGFFFQRVALVAACVAVAGATAHGADTEKAAATQNAPVSDPAAVRALAADLATLRDVENIAVHFVCEKRLAALDSPLISEGELWIARRAKEGDTNGGNGDVRFSTEKPYVSELILSGGKVYARSQHEKEWTSTRQSSRPGLTAVMGQLGGWATGDAGKLSEMYAVSRAGPEVKVPEIPKSAGGVQGAAQGKVDLFVLTPVNKDLAIAIKQVTIGMEGNVRHGDAETGGRGERGSSSLNPAKPGAADAVSRLGYVEIETAQEDLTRYWFLDGQINSQLPADVFKPTAARPGGGNGGNGNGGAGGE